MIMNTSRILVILLLFFSLLPITAKAAVTIKGSGTTSPSVVTVYANGTNSQNGTALINAVNSVSAYSNTVIKLEPGTYNIGTQTLVMPTAVDLEGSGRDLTMIVGSNSACDVCIFNGVLMGNNNSEVRDLTISNIQTALDGVPYGVYNNVGNAKFSNVNIYVEAAANSQVDAVGMWNVNANNPFLTDVKIEVVNGKKGYGIMNISTNPWLSKVDISVTPDGSGSESYGIYNKNSSPWIRYSYIGSYSTAVKGFGIFSESTDSLSYIVHVLWSEIVIAGGQSGEGHNFSGVYGGSLIHSNMHSVLFTGSNFTGGPQTGGTGTFKCHACADQYLNALTSTCTSSP